MTAVVPFIHLNSSSVLQSIMLQIAATWIENEKKELVAAKEAYMSEKCPSPNLSGDQAALMVSDAAGFLYQHFLSS